MIDNGHPVTGLSGRHATTRTSERTRQKRERREVFRSNACATGNPAANPREKLRTSDPPP
jgi:hypothetical protein